MADVNLLQQEVILLKLRIAKLEADKRSLQSDVAVLTAERDQADRAVDKLSETVQQLKNQLKDAYGSDDEESDDTPSATSVQEDSE
jgi:uncharacterized protein YlxW (UPF0749 family)